MKSFYRPIPPIFAFALPIIAVCLLLLPTRVQATSVMPKPGKLGLCVGCHGENGKATLTTYPHLAGQNRDYLINALRAYQSGARVNAEMKASTGTLKPADIVALAAWYSAQKP